MKRSPIFYRSELLTKKFLSGNCYWYFRHREDFSKRVCGPRVTNRTDSIYIFRTNRVYESSFRVIARVRFLAFARFRVFAEVVIAGGSQAACVIHSLVFFINRNDARREITLSGYFNYRSPPEARLLIIMRGTIFKCRAEERLKLRIIRHS